MARTVLLADDSVTAQNMGRRILIDAGYEVVTVNNGSAALKKIHESRPDLIVLDVYMPGYGGLEVCQRLKESAETAKIPILLTVGKMEPFKIEEAKRARADGHIVKPFEAGELLAALTRLEDRIVPQAEPGRGRKSKSHKKNGAWQVADPAMQYEDSNSEKIAYLAEVKQRRARKQEDEEERDGNVDAEASASEANVASASQERSPRSEGPEMPRPMSVYAAEALRELPVIASSAPTPAETEVALEQQPAAEGPVAETQDTEPSPPAPEMPSLAAAEVPPTTISDSIPVSMEESADAGSVESVSSQAVSENTLADAAHTEPAFPEAQAAVTEHPESAESMRADGETRWVAQNVPLSAEEASLELEREMQQARASNANSQIDQVSVTAISTDARNDPSKGATFAAAAGASTSSGPNVVSTPESESEPAMPEAAAAWENWQHIRDSVMSAQTATSISEAVANVVQDAVSPPSAQESRLEIAEQSAPGVSEPPQAEGPTDADAEAAALSSIVDSVLAELKPKLMQEISKKLKK